MDQSTHASDKNDEARDSLTGMAGRGGLTRDIALRLVTADSPPVPVALIELRGLADFNDRHGRRAGDSVVVALGRRLDRLMRDEFGALAEVYRVDGARFALLAPPGAGVERLRIEARGIAGALADAFPASAESPLSLRLSVGSITAEQDIAMALAAIARRLAAPPALVRAIDLESAARGDGLSVLFQPQFSLSDDRLVGAEALVRWQHPRLGEVGGALLFAAAGSAGLETRLSRTIWARALDMMARWPRRLHGIRVALNVTAGDLAEPGMADMLIAMARDAGVDCRRLSVEVTEAALIAQIDRAAETLGVLRSAGFLAALDDFGTGYSGLSWLKRLPVDYIKIDSGFARDADGPERDRAVLRGIVDLARAIDLGVMAEGVETAEQRDRLAALGCRWYQGFLKAPALPDDAFRAMALADESDTDHGDAKGHDAG